jgi:hypothetical protein
MTSEDDLEETKDSDGVMLTLHMHMPRERVVKHVHAKTMEGYFQDELVRRVKTTIGTKGIDDV